MTFSNSWYKKEYLLGLGGLGGGAGGILVAGGPITSSSDGYQIKKSLRFIPGNASYLAKTVGASGDRRRWTVSFWLKNSEITAEYPTIFSSSKAANTNDHFIIRIEYPGGELKVDERTSSSSSYSLNTTHKHRDHSAWYHFVIAFDSRESTSSERLKIYRNGKRETEVSGSYPAQDYASHWLETSSYANNHVIGREAARSDYETSGYLADVQVIDGLALSPAAFGEFSTTKLWNPISMVPPAPNDGTTWSSSLTSSTGSFYTGQGAAKGFDGDVTTQAGSSTGAGTLTFEPTDGIAVKSSIEITSNWNANHLKITTWIDDVKQTSTSHTGSGHAWQKIYEGGGNLTKILIEPPASGKSAEFYAIRVDGVILVDDQNDPTTRNNRNDGTNWTTGSGYLTRVGNWSEANAAITFDGDLSSTPQWNANYDSAYFKPGWTGIKKIRIYFTEVGTGSAAFSINGTDYKASAAAVGDNAWWTAPSSITTIDTTNGIHWGRVNNADEFKVSAIEIDGHILIDDAPDNSVHLKFDDITKNRYLGKDILSGKIEDATGGLPIYDTSDDGGDTKGSGYRTDSSAGTTDGAGLVFAMPGDTVTDVHASVNTGSSNNTVTAWYGGLTTSTVESRFYGSSIRCDGRGVLQTNNTTDFVFGTSAWCIEMWVKNTSSTDDRGFFHLSGDSGWAAAEGFALFWHQNKWKFRVKGGGGDKQCESSSVAHINEWYHVALTYDGTNTLKFFVNGTLEDTETQAYDFSASDGGYINIGGYYSGDYRGTGYLQDIRIYRVQKYSSDFKPPTRNDFRINNINSESTGVTGSTSFTASGGKSMVVKAVGGGTVTGTFNAAGNSTGNINYYRSDDGITWSYIEQDTGESPSYTSKWLAMGGGSAAKQFTSTSGSYQYSEEGSTSLDSNTAVQTIDQTGITFLGTLNTYGLDSLTDSPTSYLPTDGVDGNGGVTRGNYCTWNPLSQYGTTTLSDGNLKAVTTTNSQIDGTFMMPYGKWYFEWNCNTTAVMQIGIVDTQGLKSAAAPGGASKNGIIYLTTTVAGDTNTGKLYNNGTEIITGWPSTTTNSLVMVAYDADTGKLWFGKDGTWYNDSSSNTGNPATGANPSITVSSTYRKRMVPVCGAGGGSDAANGYANFGQNAYKYTAPDGFKTLCTLNLSDTFGANNNALEDKNDPSKYFDIKTYVGSGGSQTISGLGFAPDMIWSKSRSGAVSHIIYDRIRGAGENKGINPDLSRPMGSCYDTASGTAYGYVSAFTSDGYTVADGNQSTGYTNKSGSNYVGWCWDAGTAASGANTDGTINIADGDQWVSTASGFSITKYTGTGADATFGHGLGAQPEFMIFKVYGADKNWTVQHVGNTLGTGRLILDENYGNNSSFGDTYWNSTAPTSTVISIGDHANTNGSGEDHICYAWTPIAGYSKFGKWTGTGADPGPFIYLGFRPRYFFMKELDDATNWLIYDSERDSANPTQFHLFPNTNDAGNTYDASNTDLSLDFLSNGVKVRNSNSGVNASGDTYIYAAFAEHPYKTSRAR